MRVKSNRESGAFGDEKSLKALIDDRDPIARPFVQLQGHHEAVVGDGKATDAFDEIEGALVHQGLPFIGISGHKR